MESKLMTISKITEIASRLGWQVKTNGGEKLLAKTSVDGDTVEFRLSAEDVSEALNLLATPQVGEDTTARGQMRRDLATAVAIDGDTLRVSANGHFVTVNNQPFMWLTPALKAMGGFSLPCAKTTAEEVVRELNRQREEVLHICSIDAICLGLEDAIAAAIADNIRETLAAA